jgi:centractin
MELLKPKVIFSTTFEREFVRDIKEQCCFIKANVGQQPSQVDKKRYQLPDGKMIDLKFEQHNAPEVLFNTTHIGRDDGQNLQNLVANSLEKCEVDNRKSLASNIILAGGTTMFRGFT